jgi:tetratricopeptide (TPR) repeat protein/predicted Ser/Thr protein kinase
VRTRGSTEVGEENIGVETLADDSGEGAEERELERGDEVGRYVVLSTVGAGAMGIVYGAYDPELDRKLALKLLSPLRRGRNTEAARTRLLREAQSLAKLSHPNVVTVHDVGTHGGQIFVAMEFVEGQTLTRWLADEHTWPEVVQTMLGAARGLAAAHEADLVHRDFKPDNVMLGDDGRVRVMDFGLARAGDPRSEISQTPSTSGVERSDVGEQELSSLSAPLSIPLTQTGALLGTPAYMAPEQHLGGHATPLSDQFSFCVVLYECLYGQRPFRGDNLAALSFNVGQGSIREPPRDRSVPSRVHQVVIRGLSAKPGARYPSMGALLDALQSASERRRWPWFAGGFGIVGAAVLGVVASGFPGEHPCDGVGRAIDRTWSDSKSAAIHESFVATDLPYAEQAWETVRGEIQSRADGWRSGRREACTATMVEGDQSPRMMELRMACLDRQLVDISATISVLEDADAGVVENAVSAVAGLPDPSACANAEALLTRLPEPNDPKTAQEVSAIRESLSRVAADERSGRYELALSAVTELHERANVVDHPPVVVEALYRKGSLLDKAGKFEEAKPVLEDAYFLALEIGHDDHAARSATRLTYLVGSVMADHEQGLEWSRHGESILARLDVDADRRASLLNARGTVLRRQGKLAEAAQAHRQALVDLEAKGDQETLRAASAHNGIGVALAQSGDFTAAREHLTQALEIRRALLGLEHPQVATSLNNVANTDLFSERYSEAKRGYEQALKIKEELLGPDHPNVAIEVNNLGEVHRRLGELESARTYFERALEIRRATHGEDHPQVAAAMGNLGIVESMDGDHLGAKKRFARVLEINEARLAPDHPSLASALNNLASECNYLGEYETALNYHRRALEIREKKLGAKHADTLTSQSNLGNTYLYLGRPDEAARHYELALEGNRLLHGEDHQATIVPRARLAVARVEAGDRAEIESELDWALEHLEADDEANRGLVQFALARLQWDRGRRGEARSLATSAVELLRSGSHEYFANLATQWMERPSLE